MRAARVGECMRACMHAATCTTASTAFACIARGGACHPFFLFFFFFVLCPSHPPLVPSPPRVSLLLRLLELRILLALDGIIYRKKNNEIRIIYHRGRFPPRFAKFTFELLRRYFPFRSRSRAASARELARAPKIICYRRFAIALSSSLRRASSYLGTSGTPPRVSFSLGAPRRPW